MFGTEHLKDVLALAHQDMCETLDNMDENEVVTEAFKLSMNKQRERMNTAVLADMMEQADREALEKAIAKLESSFCTTC